jgi:hypothetical protein
MKQPVTFLVSIFVFWSKMIDTVTLPNLLFVTENLIFLIPTPVRSVLKRDQFSIPIPTRDPDPVLEHCLYVFVNSDVVVGGVELKQKNNIASKNVT